QKLLKFEKKSGQFFSDSNKFLHHTFAEYLANKENIITLDDRLHIYHEGKYISDENLLKRKMTALIPELKEKDRNEVIHQLRYTTPIKEHAEARYIGVKNGVYDLKENELLESSPGFIITNQI